MPLEIIYLVTAHSVNMKPSYIDKAYHLNKHMEMTSDHRNNPKNELEYPNVTKFYI